MSNVSPLRGETESPFHTGDRIRKVRELTGYETRKGEFAELIGIDRGSLAKYESTGRVKMPIIHAIANTTKARFEFLAYGTGPVFDEPHPKNPLQETFP